MDIPNPLIKDKFLTRIIVYREGKRTSYKMYSPELLQRTIEASITNGRGYAEDFFIGEKNISGENISKDELHEYYNDKEQLTKDSFLNFRKDQLFNLFYTLIDQENIIDFYYKNAITLENLSRKDMDGKAILLNGNNTYTILEEPLASKGDMRNIEGQLGEVEEGIKNLMEEINYYKGNSELFEMLYKDSLKNQSAKNKEIEKLKGKLKKKNSKGLVSRLFNKKLK